MHIRYLILIVILNLILIGCSDHRNILPNNQPEKIYASAKKKLYNGHYSLAIKELNTLNYHYPFVPPYTERIQFDLIYAYYKSGNFTLANTYINRFLRLNSKHPNTEYLLYMHGLSNMALDDNIFQKFFGVDRSDRDPKYSRIAFHYFKKLIHHYPKSQYAMDAKQRLLYLKNRLAKHELGIVKYYNKQRAYVAVANRVEKMLRDFPDTQATYQALPYMKRAYQELQLNDLANQVTKIIDANSNR